MCSLGSKLNRWAAARGTMYILYQVSYLSTPVVAPPRQAPQMTPPPPPPPFFKRDTEFKVHSLTIHSTNPYNTHIRSVPLTMCCPWSA